MVKTLLLLKSLNRLGRINTLCFLFLLQVCSLPALSQSKANYTLLWRISGNGLKKPSYLFGTMHVKDRRAFAFSDSVMLALQKSDAFALEIHPDTLMNAMYDAMNNSDSGKIKSMLDEDQYGKLSQRFEEKNGYAMDNINPLLVESLIKKDRSKPDDQTTFVDAYLYGIAKTLHKNISGLEKAVDHLKTLQNNNLKDRIETYLNDEGTEDEDEALNELTELYSSGNLDLLHNYFNYNDAFDTSLTARNKVMFNSMILQMQGQGLFTAVGVAHLPGNEGLIALLKARGYKVTPVDATFTGVSKLFKIDQSQFKWTNYIAKEEGFSFEMPGTPFAKDAGAGKMNVLIYSDMINNVYYGAYAYPIAAAVTNTDIRGVLKNALAVYKMSAKGHISNERDVTVNGLPGVILSSKNGDYTSQMLFVMQNSKLYCLYISNNNNNNTLDKYAQNRFFYSLKVFKTATKPVSSWVKFKDNKGAFEISVPVQPQILDKVVPNPADTSGNPYLLRIYIAADNAHMINYLIRYTDLPAGMYIKDKEASFESMIASVKAMGSVRGKPVKLYKSGFEGRAIKLMVKGLYADVQLYIRGNRQYMLLRQSAEGKAQLAIKDNFFNSFKFTDYEPAPAYTFKSNDETFSVDMFTAPKTTVDTTAETSYVNNLTVSISTNPSSGAVYSVEHSKLSPYYKANNVDLVYKRLIKDLNGYTDSVLRVDTVLYNSGKGLEFITQNRYTRDKKRHRLYIDNANIVYLTGSMNSDEYFSKTSNRFFTSYKSLKTAPSFDLAGLKGSMIVKNLRSSDSTTFKKSRAALSYYNFDKQELPLVYSALKSAYPDDTLNLGVRHSLLNVLTEINDGNVLAELETLFKSSTTNDDLKFKILSTLPEVDKQKGYALYLNLLTQEPYFNSIKNYKAFSPLNDSLAYAAANFQRLIPLLEHTPYRYQIVSLANGLLDDKEHPEYKQLVKTHYQALTKYINKDLQAYLTDTLLTSYNTGVFYYLQIMKKLPGSAANDKFTSAIIAHKNDSRLLNAVQTRIANHLPVALSIVNPLLDSLYSRFEVMDAYNKVNQLIKVPAKYRTPAEFGRLCLYNYVGENSDEENYPEKISALGTMVNKGAIYYAYKFTMPEGDGFKECIGVYESAKNAGKFDFENYHSYSEWDTLKTNWQSQAQKLIIKWKNNTK
jgi:uncharacterized protein YbaP (TraB family)